MFVFIFLLAILNTAESQCISLEQKSSGWIQCSNIQQTIQFTQEFCEPPKIIIKSVNYSNFQVILLYERYHLSNFIFKILTSTTTNFQYQLQCILSLQYYIIYFQFYFEWAALIEDKILVFNDFMQSIPLIDGYKTRLIPYFLQNTDYEISYSITSYSGGTPYIIIEKQATGFHLYVTGVNSTQLNGLGVQIIAGLKSLYTLFDSMSVQQCEVYTSFPKMSGFRCKIKFILDQTNQIGIVVQQNINDDISYSYGQKEYRRISYYWTCPSSSFSINFKVYIYEFLYFPHQYKKIRVAQMMSLDYKFIDSFDTQRLYFQEANQTWIDSNIPNSTIQYNQKTISLIYSHQCQPNRKIIVTILRKGQKGLYNYIYPLYCHRLYNLITMYIYLDTTNFDSSELQISLHPKIINKIQNKSLQQLIKEFKYKRKYYPLEIQLEYHSDYLF